MKRISRTLLSLVLCLTVALSMCATFTVTADAATKYSGDTISLTDIDGVSAPNVNYQTQYLYRNSSTLKYTLKLPSSGGTVYALVPEDYFYGVKVNGSYSYDSMNINTFKMRAFSVSGNTATFEMTPSYSTTGSYNFGLWYSPARKSIPANGKQYTLGASGTSAASAFTVSVPGKGYLEVTAFGGIDTPISAQIITSGFKGWESTYSRTGYKTKIGVKAGTYTVSVKSSSLVRNVKVTYHAVKESSCKTSKKKAAKIKRKKVNRGLIVTNNKKVHWYKIKNTKSRKMKLVVNATNVGEGAPYSAKLKVTCYFPNKKKSYGYIYPGEKDTFTITYGKIGTKKAKKGTYYIKVQSLGGANGYYTVQWK